MKITLAQLNPIIGDYAGNLAKIEETLVAVAGERPDLVVFPELFLTGYPPRDLLERAWFITQAQEAVEKLLAISCRFPSIGIIVGVPLPAERAVGKGLNNTALLIENGRVVFRQNKSLLPTYDVFDEARYFDPATEIGVAPYRGELLGISICEDA
ncbi:MAG: NAD+ synthase, partial [Anaerolineae bacterium]|nr:NAD+ synthase [Anaerolineae bacterium]